MKTYSFVFAASGTKRLPKNMKIYGMEIQPSSSTFATVNGYAYVRLIDKDEGTMDIDDHPVIFHSSIQSKLDVFTNIQNIPRSSKWMYCYNPFLAVVVSSIPVLVIVYVEDAKIGGNG